MAINTDVKLQLPEYAYGAVYGRDRSGQVKRYKIFAVTCSLWLASVVLAVFFKTVFPNLEGYWGETLHGFTIFFAITVGIVGWLLGLFPSLLTYSSGVYNSDIYHGRQDYAKTVFKEWFEERYGTKINEQNAVHLMNGDLTSIPRVTVTADGEERVEYVRARFEYNHEFEKFSAPGRDCTGEDGYGPNDWVAPVINEGAFHLRYLEEPAKPRMYAW